MKMYEPISHTFEVLILLVAVAGGGNLLIANHSNFSPTRLLSELD